MWNYLKGLFVTEVKVPKLPIGIPVGNTALWIAAIRATETENPNPRFRDPYARLLAGPEGFQIFDIAIGSLWYMISREKMKQIQVDSFTLRTLHFDNLILNAAKEGIDQIVIVASGCDTRAWRLDWRQKVTVFEMDYEEVLKWKMEKLHSVNAIVTCGKHETVGCDLVKENWEQLLMQKGFDQKKPAVFILEGLLMYLSREENLKLLSRLSAISAPGSLVSADAVTTKTLPYSNATLNKLGCPAKFGLENPGELLTSSGWADFGSRDAMEEKRNETPRLFRSWVSPYWLVVGKKQ